MCVCVCMCLILCESMYVCMFASVGFSNFVFVCMCVCVCVSVYVCMCMILCMYATGKGQLVPYLCVCSCDLMNAHVEGCINHIFGVMELMFGGARRERQVCTFERPLLGISGRGMVS
jgi:hypothetical protein